MNIARAGFSKRNLILIMVIICFSIATASFVSERKNEAQQDRGDFSFGDSDGIFCTDVPGIPDNVESSDGLYWDKIQTVWDETTCATSYKIYRSTGSSIGPFDDYLGETTDLFWDFSTTDNVIRWFSVEACNSYGCGYGMAYDSTGGFATAEFDTIGLYSPNQKKWYLKRTPANGWVDYDTVKFGGDGPNWVPVTGDWNGNGQDTIGFYFYDQKKWYLKNTLDDGWVNFESVKFGSTNTNWIPITGDWNGNGTDTVGFYVPSQKKWYLKMAHSDGWVDYVGIKFGSTDTSWQPVAGDWDMDGYDEIGFLVPDQQKWYLKDSLIDGWVDYTAIKFGSTGSSWIAVVGNWGNT